MDKGYLWVGGKMNKDCTCLSGFEGIKTIRTMFDERHELYCDVVRWEIKKGYRDKKTYKLKRISCDTWGCEIDVSVCPILCTEREINDCELLKGMAD